jgi:hypothetical protein
MRRNPDIRTFWFKASVAVGFVLALVLLAQSIANYHYISRRLVQQSAIQEAERRVVTLEKAIRNANARDAAQLASVIEQLRTESIEQVAWIRVTTFTGDIIAATGNATGAPFAAELLKRLVEERQPIHETRKTKTKEVFVSVYPVRLGFAFRS